MVFITQVILIAFVIIDVWRAETMTAHDGTSKVPIVGTLGSWLIYLLGIFMQVVYLLGPKTNFGTSEQNPHFWVQLLLSAKGTGAQCKWYDEVYDTDKIMQLRPNDRRSDAGDARAFSAAPVLLPPEERPAAVDLQSVALVDQPAQLVRLAQGPAAADPESGPRNGVAPGRETPAAPRTERKRSGSGLGPGRYPQTQWTAYACRTRNVVLQRSAAPGSSLAAPDRPGSAAARDPGASGQGEQGPLRAAGRTGAGLDRQVPGRGATAAAG